MPNNCTEAAFESAIELDVLAKGYVSADKTGFDRERAIFPQIALDFIRETQPKEWAKLEALHGARTGELVLADLCKWMDCHGSLATLRHGFKCYGRTLRIAFFKAAHGLNPELEARYRTNPRRHHPATGLQRPQREDARRDDQPQRHPRRHGGTQESAHRADLRGRQAPILPGP